MTIVVQFENNNWYAEGVAIMADNLFEHPLMIAAHDAIAKEIGFDFVSAFERATEYEHYHKIADESE